MLKESQQVKTVELMYRKKDGWLWGMRLLGPHRKLLFETGLMSNKIYKQCQDEWPLVSVTLIDGERILGFKGD